MLKCNYHIKVVVPCKEEQIALVRSIAREGYSFSYYGGNAILEGRGKGQEDVEDIESLLCSFPDHEIRLQRDTL